jgi:hypothetical protein
MQYEFKSEAHPIKFQQLHVQAFKLNKKAKEISKGRSLSDKV